MSFLPDCLFLIPDDIIHISKIISACRTKCTLSTSSTSDHFFSAFLISIKALIYHFSETLLLYCQLSTPQKQCLLDIQCSYFQAENFQSFASQKSCECSHISRGGTFIFDLKDCQYRIEIYILLADVKRCDAVGHVAWQSAACVDDEMKASRATTALTECWKVKLRFAGWADDTRGVVAAADCLAGFTTTSEDSKQIWRSCSRRYCVQGSELLFRNQPELLSKCSCQGPSDGVKAINIFTILHAVKSARPMARCSLANSPSQRCQELSPSSRWPTRCIRSIIEPFIVLIESSA